MKDNTRVAAVLTAGAANVDVTSGTPQFLFGYPHVHRMSTGVHDPLLSSALFLTDGRTPLLMVANDVIFIGKAMATRVRERIEAETGVSARQILLTATHTHSGPVTVDMASNEADPVVPKADSAYVRFLEDGMVAAAVKAWRQSRPAELGLVVADGSCVGTNRHDPTGPHDPQVPVLVVRDLETHAHLAAMLVCSMHPTVLHEDSTLVSGDFPAMVRQYLQRQVLGESCVVLHHTGPCGDQSPRHVTRGNTFAEAERLGQTLGRVIERSLENVQYSNEIALACTSSLVELPRRAMPSAAAAEDLMRRAAARLASLRSSNATRAEVRTAECDLFGAEETLALAAAAAGGRLDAIAASSMPAEILAMRIGEWTFVGWPGEVYVEFALAVKAGRPGCFVISLANGELQGYLATQQAVEQQRYEAMNAMFASPQSGNLLVQRTLELLGQ